MQQDSDAIYVTDQLRRRPVSKTNHLQEKQAIQELAQHMVTNPEAVLPRFVDLALEITGGASGGLSLIEGETAPGACRWRHVRGALAHLENVLLPRLNSPCAVATDTNAPVLVASPERRFYWLAESNLTLPEALLVPLRLDKDEHLGTLWVVADKEGHFNRGHVRAMTELSTFVSAALQMVLAQRNLATALAALDARRVG